MFTFHIPCSCEDWLTVVFSDPNQIINQEGRCNNSIFGCLVKTTVTEPKHAFDGSYYSVHRFRDQQLQPQCLLQRNGRPGGCNKEPDFWLLGCHQRFFFSSFVTRGRWGVGGSVQAKSEGRGRAEGAGGGVFFHFPQAPKFFGLQRKKISVKFDRAKIWSNF